MHKRFTVNDADRREWTQNNEGLYAMWKRSRTGLYRWVRENRDVIDAVIARNVPQFDPDRNH